MRYPMSVSPIFEATVRHWSTCVSVRTRTTASVALFAGRAIGTHNPVLVEVFGGLRRSRRKA